MSAICIVCHNGVGALQGFGGHIGGVERQTAMLAKHLAARGHRVSYVVWGGNESIPSQIDGVDVLPICRVDAGVRGLRFFHPRWTSLFGALKAANAEVYYHNGAEYITGQVAAYCKVAGRSFVFSAASDTDCDASLPALTSARERVLYRYGLRTATKVLVQTRSQQSQLRRDFGLDGLVMPMPCVIQPVAEESVDAAHVFRVLWVGRIVRTKRLEMYLEVAASNPDIEFHIAGGADDDENYASSVIAKARQEENVTYHGVVQQTKLSELYRSASVLACTSSLEGFPNTFLEAWGHGVPVLSTFDPDDTIRTNGLGVSVQDAASLTAAIREMRQSHARFLEMKARCKEYFLRKHEAGTALRGFEDVLTGAAVVRSH